MSSQDDSELYSDEEFSQDHFGYDDATNDSLASLQQYDDEIPGPSEGPLYDLAQALASASSNLGEFSFGGRADFLPSDPELHIVGFGDVALPLVDKAQAETLMQVCEQAPYGNGSKTLVDTAVRNSWQLDPSKITLNPPFISGIQSARDLIARGLGVVGTPLTIEPYKFLLYGPGGHFAKHRDTEKADRMFATLIVQLPSAHSGGNLVVYGEDTERVVYDFGQDGSAERCHYAVHYADAEHSLEPVTEGYRLALVYSICWPADAIQPAPGPSSYLLTPMSQAMVALADADSKFHLFLSHDYTPKSVSELGLGALKGIDRVRINNLGSVSAGLDSTHRFVLCIGKAERHTSYGGLEPPWSKRQCHDWELSDEPREGIRQLLTEAGKVLVSMNTNYELPILESESCLNPGRKRISELWRGNREVDYEGYLGNEGPTKDTTYHKYVVLAWPERTACEHLLGVTGEEVGWKAMMESEPNAAQLERFLGKMVEARWSHSSALQCEDHIDHRSGKKDPPLVPRHVVFRKIQAHSADSDYVGLVDKYISLFPVASKLTAGGNGWTDLLCLVNDAPTWSRVKDKVINILSSDTEAIFSFLAESIDASVPREAYRPVEEALLEPKSASEGFHKLSVQQAIFRALLKSDNSTFCFHVIGQYRRAMGRTLDVPIAAILKYYQSSRSLFTTEKRTLLTPMIRTRIKWSIGYQAEVASEGHGWAFKNATFTSYSDQARAIDILAFLKRDQKEMVIQPFPNIKEARRFCERNKGGAQNCSFTMEAKGAGKKAHVLMTKNKSFFGQRTKRANDLAVELKKLERILEAVAGGVERPLGEVEVNVSQQEEDEVDYPGTKPVKRARKSRGKS